METLKRAQARVAKKAMIQSQPPCEKYNCEYYERCKHCELACKAFWWYVTSGISVHPQTTWDKRKLGKLDKNMKPTRRMYLKIHKE